jgi:hypothetical protein
MVPAGIFLFATASRPALGLIKPPTHWLPGLLSAGIEWPVGEASDTIPSSAEVKEVWRFDFTPPLRVHGEAVN